ncbi:MAG: LysM peptidoglycan-binding domain-containing protein [Chloroflexi bacterium]|nr:MAG: LysM peptidoglycan-binding domain-containing protein [Chloroflexota bacterium]
MTCYACGKTTTLQCLRCARAYCPEHGESSAGARPLCAECLSPLSAAPSGTVFRISLFALLGASVLALWLLIRPPSLPGETSSASQPRPTAVASAAATKAAASGSASPSAAAATSSPEGSPSPAPATPAPATPAPTPAGPTEYTVQPGDSLASIANAYGLTYLDMLAANGLTEDQAKLLQPGDKVVIPAR